MSVLENENPCLLRSFGLFRLSSVQSRFLAVTGTSQTDSSRANYGAWPMNDQGGEAAGSRDGCRG